MTGNQTIDYYVRPQHLYSHSRTCTHRGLCRRPSRLVEFHIWYLLGGASVHEISTLMTWFQYVSDISSHYGDLDPLYIFSHYGDHDPLYIFIMEIMIYVYCMWRWPHIWYHGHCTLMYPGLLYVFAVICRVVSLYYADWVVGLPLGSSSLHFWDGLIMYFSHSITPLTSHLRGHLLQLILQHMVDHTFVAFPVPLQTL